MSTTNRSDDTTDTQTTDAYDNILRSLEQGVIVTINENTPNAKGMGEFTVEYSDNTATNVGLKKGRQNYQIKRKDGNIVIGKQSETNLKRTETVVTIEILGVRN